MFNLFFREWRQFWHLAEMRLLSLSLLISVIAVTSVGFFTDRADNAMKAQAIQLLGGDLVIASTRPIDPLYLDQASQRGLRHAQMISFPSMLSRGDQFQLAQIKAVSSHYPLYGDLKIRQNLQANSPATIMMTDTLANDAIFAEPRLFNALHATVGQTVQLGKSQLRLAGIISKMPDQNSSIFQLAPQLILPLDKLNETGLLSAASRAHYHFLFRGDLNAIEAFKAWLKPQLKPSENIPGLENGSPAIQQALERGQRFLKIAALLAVILAGAGIALSSYSLSQRESTAVAVLKSLGASRRFILKRYLRQMLINASLAGLLGGILGYLIHFLLVIALQHFIEGDLPTATLLPLLIGFLTAWMMVLGFSLPQLIYLIKIAPIEIFQKQNRLKQYPYLLSVFTLSLAVWGVMWLQTEEAILSFYLLSAVIVAIIIFWLLTIGILKLIVGFQQRLGLPKKNQRMVILVVVFSMGFFSLLLLSVLRSELINRWQDSLPSDAPNHFLMNIQPQEAEPLKAFFQQKNINAPLYPMILARLTHINGVNVSIEDFDNRKAKSILKRELSLSTSMTLPDSNQLVAGQWFTTDATQGLSIAEGLAKALNVKQGDTLSFNVAGQTFTEAIISIRRIQWDSMKPNFLVLLAPTILEDKPKTFITSVYLNEAHKGLLPKLLQQYPSLTDINLDPILQTLRALINKVSFVVQAIFSFTLLSGLVVLLAALQSQKAVRRREIAILKSLGASRQRLRRHLGIEFAFIGALAGFLASLFAVFIGNVIAYALFDLSPEMNFRLILIGTSSGALLVGLAGYWNVRHLLNVAPISLFR